MSDRYEIRIEQDPFYEWNDETFEVLVEDRHNIGPFKEGYVYCSSLFQEDGNEYECGVPAGDAIHAPTVVGLDGSLNPECKFTIPPKAIAPVFVQRAAAAIHSIQRVKPHEANGWLMSKDVDDVESWTDEQIDSVLKTINLWIDGETYFYSIVKIVTCPCCGHDYELVLDSCGGFFGYDAVHDEAAESAKALGIEEYQVTS